jgi:hypothetical protein
VHLLAELLGVALFSGTLLGSTVLLTGGGGLLPAGLLGRRGVPLLCLRLLARLLGQLLAELLGLGLLAQQSCLRLLARLLLLDSLSSGLVFEAHW